MSYADTAATAIDEAFIARVMACGVQQALTFVNDARPEFKNYAQAVIASENNARQLVWPVCGQPAITAVSADPDLLAAVQAVWPLVGASYVPAA
jgi:hypothetical protein